MTPIKYRSLTAGMYIVGYAKGIKNSVGVLTRQVVTFKVDERRRNSKDYNIEFSISIVDDLQIITHGDPKRGTDFHELKKVELVPREYSKVTLTRKYDENYEYFLMTNDEVLTQLVVKGL